MHVICFWYKRYRSPANLSLARNMFEDTTASEPSEMPYKIFCMIIGHDSTIPVNINETETVDDLKKAIKEENKPELDACAADALTLFRVGIEIAKSGDKRTRIEELKRLSRNLNEDEALDEEAQISTILGKNPPEKDYILVRLPEGQSASSLCCPRR